MNMGAAPKNKSVHTMLPKHDRRYSGEIRISFRTYPLARTSHACGD